MEYDSKLRKYRIHYHCLGGVINAITSFMEKEKIYKRLGQNIQRLRKQCGITQAELAEKISRSEDAISNLERGTSAPPPETAVLLADAFGCELSDLYDFDWSDELKPQDISEYIRIMRARLLLVPEAQRTQMYSLIDGIFELFNSKPK